MRACVRACLFAYLFVCLFVCMFVCLCEPKTNTIRTTSNTKLYLPVLVSSRVREVARLPSRLFPRLPDDPLLLRLQSDIGDDAVAELPFPVDSLNVGLTSSLKSKPIKFIVDEAPPSGATVLDMSGMLKPGSVPSKADR